MHHPRRAQEKHLHAYWSKFLCWWRPSDKEQLFCPCFWSICSRGRSWCCYSLITWPPTRTSSRSDRVLLKMLLYWIYLIFPKVCRCHFPLADMWSLRPAPSASTCILTDTQIQKPGGNGVTSCLANCLLRRRVLTDQAHVGDFKRSASLPCFSLSFLVQEHNLRSTAFNIRDHLKHTPPCRTQPSHFLISFIWLCILFVHYHLTVRHKSRWTPTTTS